MATLNALIPYLDPIMAFFYQDMLSHKYLASFFSGEEQIRQLIERQKKNFIDSLDDSEEEFKDRYKRLGALHYQLRLPAVDFLKGTEIFRSSFIDYAIEEIKDLKLIRDINHHFRVADVWMCRGYLESQLPVDRRDLKSLMLQIEKADSNVIEFGLPHLNWLNEILDAVEAKDASMVSGLSIEDCTIHKFLDDHDPETELPFSREHFDDLHRRLHIDAQSLFYFLEHDDYPEAIAIYSSLLNVYKMTLVFLGNHYTRMALERTKSELANANQMIDTLRSIIPICSKCHKIRDDAGNWQNLETYLKQHSGVVLTHGYCPDCADHFYKDFVNGNGDSD